MYNLIHFKIQGNIFQTSTEYMINNLISGQKYIRFKYQMDANVKHTFQTCKNKNMKWKISL